MRSVSCPARPRCPSLLLLLLAREWVPERGGEREEICCCTGCQRRSTLPASSLLPGPVPTSFISLPLLPAARLPSFLPLLSKRTHQSPTHPFSNGQRDGAVAPPFPQRWTETARGKWQAQFPPPSSSVATCRFATPALSLAPAVPALQMHHFQTHPFYNGQRDGAVVPPFL